MNEYLEELAELEHEQWAHWTAYLFKRLSLSPNSLRVDEKTKKDFERWVSQIITPYKDLSKKEKDADRIWADKVMALNSKKIWEYCYLKDKTSHDLFKLFADLTGFDIEKFNKQLSHTVQEASS